jgi:hypothetical protein
MPINPVSDQARLMAQVVHCQIGHMPFVVPFEFLRFPDHRVRATLNGLRDEIAPIRLHAAISDKGIAALYGTAVGG